MPAPVARVTIHHEGAGGPTDNVARYSHAGYSAGIGLTRFELIRPPWESWATFGFNRVSVDICLSGNRELHVVTGTDVELVRRAVAEARTRGWLVDVPEVVAHRDSPGSATVCPGRHTIARWREIVDACTKPVPKVGPMYDPAIDVVGGIVASAVCPAGGAWLLGGRGHVYTLREKPGGKMAPYRGDARPDGALHGPAVLIEPARYWDGAVRRRSYRITHADGFRRIHRGT